MLFFFACFVDHRQKIKLDDLISLPVCISPSQHNRRRNQREQRMRVEANIKAAK